MKKHVLCVAAVLAFAGAVQAESVTNGGFETGDFTGWSQFGNTGFTGVGAGTQASGTYGAFFGPVGSTGGITQTLALPANANVTVSFWLHNDGGGFNSFDASFDGSSLLSFTNAGGIGYNFYSYNVTTTAANPALTFTFRQDPAWWYLDDVSVTSTIVPLPTGASMGLLGLAGAGVLGRIARRRK
jgi:hypothetical protein